MNHIPELIENCIVTIFRMLSIKRPMECICFHSFLYYMSPSYTSTPDNYNEFHVSFNINDSIRYIMTRFEYIPKINHGQKSRFENIYINKCRLTIFKLVSAEDDGGDISLSYTQLHTTRPKGKA